MYARAQNVSLSVPDCPFVTKVYRTTYVDPPKGFFYTIDIFAWDIRYVLFDITYIEICMLLNILDLPLLFLMFVGVYKEPYFSNYIYI
jgi:hypothetical protein